MNKLIKGDIANAVNLPLIDRIQRDAIKYERYKDQLSQVPQSEIDLFRIDILYAYERIFNGLNKLEVKFVSGNPYDNLKELSGDIANNGILRVSGDNNDSKLLPKELNLYFRAIHDYLHYLYQQKFDFEGEYNVYKVQKFFHSTKIGRKLLYSEVVLQAAYCTYFGKFAQVQKVIIY